HRRKSSLAFPPPMLEKQGCFSYEYDGSSENRARIVVTAKPPVVVTVKALRQAVAQARGAGRSIGLVPTMGALHEGHASLCRAARSETDFVVVSIFVNPIQFGPAEDLGRYPRTLEQDLEVCGRERVHLVFAPEVAAMYPPGFCTFVEVTGLQDV